MQRVAARRNCSDNEWAVLIRERQARQASNMV
jgi:hypothetical protein